MAYEVSFNHVLGDLITERFELLVGEVLGDLVLHFKVAEDLAGPRAADAMDVLEGELHPLVVGDLHAPHSNATDGEASALQQIEGFRELGWINGAEKRRGVLPWEVKRDWRRRER